MNRDKVKKIVGISAATLALTGLFAIGFVRMVEKGLTAFGDNSGSNYVSSADKLIGVFITSGTEDDNAVQKKIQKEGKVYGTIKSESDTLGGTVLKFSSLKGEVFSTYNGVLEQPGKYGAVEYSNFTTDKEIGYDAETGKMPELMHSTYNVNLRVNINALNNKSVICINPIFEDKDGKQFVTDNKCIKLNYKGNVQDKDIENCMLETQMYNKGILKGIIPKKILIDGKNIDAIIAPVENKSFAGYDGCIPYALK